MASTEFDQAKSNMLLLDTTVQDVSLRPGAGGYVQFNEREGGIGIATTTDSLLISATNDTITNSINFNNLFEFVYSGGSLASAAVNPTTMYTALRGDLQNAYVNLTQGLGFLRLEQNNGAKIKLDYDRVRIISTGVIDSQGTNLTQITFINLRKGSTSGSGTVNVQAQNINTTSTAWQFKTGTVSITVQHITPHEVIPPSPQPFIINAPAVVIFTEIQVRVSIT
jgi:hypothetical protein